jgi:hypothetical protein
MAKPDHHDDSTSGEALGQVLSRYTLYETKTYVTQISWLVQHHYQYLPARAASQTTVHNGIHFGESTSHIENRSDGPRYVASR